MRIIRRCVVLCGDAMRHGAARCDVQRSKLRNIAWLVLLLTIYQPAYGAGTIPVALSQQSDANGRPLSGALLYTYVAGTVNAPQTTFQDFGLTVPNPWPLQADTTGRIPMFYLADGQVHVRLTDASGVVVFDYPTMQVIGPSSGGGSGGGASVDPTTVSSTGDVKWRATNETLTGWVKLDGHTISNTGQGGIQVGSNLQALYIYIWTNCPQNHCPVTGGRGASGLADWQAANKPIAVFDMRARIPFGLDDFGNGPASRLLPGNMVGSGDTPTTPNGVAGEINHTITVAQVPSYPLTLSTTILDTRTWVAPGSGTGGSVNVGLSGAGGVNAPVVVSSGSISATTSGNSGGGGTAMSIVNNSLLGTWYIKI